MRRTRGTDYFSRYNEDLHLSIHPFGDVMKPRKVGCACSVSRATTYGNGYLYRSRNEKKTTRILQRRPSIVYKALKAVAQSSYITSQPH